MYYQPTPINWNGFNFLIMSSPDDSSMKRCIAVSNYNIPKHLFLIYFYFRIGHKNSQC